jgi:hypothetical protein
MTSFSFSASSLAIFATLAASTSFAFYSASSLSFFSLAACFSLANASSFIFIS